MNTPLPPGFEFYLVSIFPEMFQSFLSAALLGKAQTRGLVRVSFVDPRDYSEDKHRNTDDTPYGGGDGMVMKPDPVVGALESIPAPAPGGRVHRVLLTPQGRPLDQPTLVRLSQASPLALVCGRYEGFDERVRSFVDEEISLGDYVLNGGEVAALAIVEGVARLLPGMLGNAGSLATESHADGLLEHPHYTRPRTFRGVEVPEVLLNGNHAEINSWRRQMMLLRTLERRPDLLRTYPLCEADRAVLDRVAPGWQRQLWPARPAPSSAQRDLAARTHVALVHYPVRDRHGKVVTTAITNLDLHDIARSSCSYGLAGYWVVTPLESQQELAQRIAGHWQHGYGRTFNPKRSEALELLQVAASIENVIQRISESTGQRPLVVTTSAAEREGQVGPAEVFEQASAERPLLLVLGTGWGLTDEVFALSDLCLKPIKSSVTYNHLSVRSAAAIILDRLFGLRD